jgi:hypothetical protein
VPTDVEIVLQPLAHFGALLARDREQLRLVVGRERRDEAAVAVGALCQPLGAGPPRSSTVEHDSRTAYSSARGTAPWRSLALAQHAASTAKPLEASSARTPASALRSAAASR